MKNWRKKSLERGLSFFAFETYSRIGGEANENHIEQAILDPHVSKTGALWHYIWNHRMYRKMVFNEGTLLGKTDSN